ncbi:ADP-forming succinate--CoA ligase subunit beta [Candidatus Pantoea carbekii]|uniref:Succinate--CoA ligase [ADP-forming] subunit beta n=1 Tax=Candidatus Pantoea carbekii TaxID=1235990 RepID=U3U6W0_9GAMM|nr:ADP-forming succinate--CoA ligase subunit beta [Candidatus Pantoea carbekii]AKC32189.1 succinyl-CoA synthetase beta chain SucC [Candidatus Pantoea carbekii]BAO00720.1 SucC protein [Candidatus Pantoea carbekii]
MNLHEYQAKQLFQQYDIPVPVSYICTAIHEAENAASKIGLAPWVAKCQVHAGGRGKAGGVKIVKNQQELYKFCENWLGKRLITYQTNTVGQLVNKILVESVTDIEQELYLGAVIDCSTRRVILMASVKGGVEIEKVAEETPHLIHKTVLDPLTGVQLYQGRAMALKLGLTTHQQIIKFSNIFNKLAIMFLECDLMMAEINPLVSTKKGDLICLDGKLSVDENALFRQPKLHTMFDVSQQDPREAHAMLLDLHYVALKGNIGCMVNGAGLAMGTMDMIKYYGGQPANFLDVGGSTTKERVTEAFKIIMSDHTVKAVFINIFGGIVRCDLIAEGIIVAVNEISINVPIVVRLEGNKAEIGTKKLENSGLNIIACTNLRHAVQSVVIAAQAGK